MTLSTVAIAAADLADQDTVGMVVALAAVEDIRDSLDIVAEEHQGDIAGNLGMLVLALERMDCMLQAFLVRILVVEDKQAWACWVLEQDKVNLHFVLVQ